MKCSIALVFMLALLGASCATAPKLSETKFSRESSLQWLNEYCAYSLVPNEKSIEGSLALKAQTPEFKGQHPASIRVNTNGSFFMEVTHILGGTIAQISGDDQFLRAHFPGREKYDQEKVTDYLGVPARIITQLFSGNLPCPTRARNQNDFIVTSEPGGVLLSTELGDWYYRRSKQEHGGKVQEVPESLWIYSGKRRDNLQKPWVVLTIAEWDFQNKYIKKATLRSQLADGLQRELKWTWKNRRLD